MKPFVANALETACYFVDWGDNRGIHRISDVEAFTEAVLNGREVMFKDRERWVAVKFAVTPLASLESFAMQKLLDGTPLT